MRPELAAGLDFPSVLHNWPTPGGRWPGGSQPQTDRQESAMHIFCLHDESLLCVTATASWAI